MFGRQTYQVQFDDGREVEVVVDGRDYMFYEKESGESAVDLIRNALTFSSWYIVTAAAMRRQGLFEGTPEEYFEQVTFVLPVGKEKAADPTTPAEESESSVSP